MLCKNSKDILFCIVFFGFAVLKAQTQEQNFDFISPTEAFISNFRKLIEWKYNGECQLLGPEDPQQKGHLLRILRSSGISNSYDDPIWTHHNGPLDNQNLESPSMDNEWARLKKSKKPFKLQKQDLSKMENEWARLKKSNTLNIKLVIYCDI